MQKKKITQFFEGNAMFSAFKAKFTKISACCYSALDEIYKNGLYENSIKLIQDNHTGEQKNCSNRFDLLVNVPIYLAIMYLCEAEQVKGISDKREILDKALLSLNKVDSWSEDKNFVEILKAIVKFKKSTNGNSNYISSLKVEDCSGSEILPLERIINSTKDTSKEVDANNYMKEDNNSDEEASFIKRKKTKGVCTEGKKANCKIKQEEGLPVLKRRLIRKAKQANNIDISKIFPLHHSSVKIEEERQISLNEINKMSKSQLKLKLSNYKDFLKLKKSVGYSECSAKHLKYMLAYYVGYSRIEILKFFDIRVETILKIFRKYSIKQNYSMVDHEEVGQIYESLRASNRQVIIRDIQRELIERNKIVDYATIKRSLSRSKAGSIELSTAKNIAKEKNEKILEIFDGLKNAVSYGEIMQMYQSISEKVCSLGSNCSASEVQRCLKSYRKMI